MKLTALSIIVLVSFVSLPVLGEQGKAAAAADARFQIPATDEGLPGSGPIRRYDWFKNLWQKKRSGWAKDVEKDQNALVFLGDSITQGWGPEMGNAFPGVKVANRGISGDTTRGMLIRLQEDVLSLNPEGVVMLMGTNDLEERAEPKTIADNSPPRRGRSEVHLPSELPDVPEVEPLRMRQHVVEHRA